MLRRLLPTNCPLRRKNLRVRAARKRDNIKDRYQPAHTKEPLVHPWFNSHKAKVLMQEYQRVRNLNRFTITYDEELRKEFAAAAQEYSLYKLHEFYGIVERQRATDKVMNAAHDAAETLPAHLYDDVLGETRPHKYIRPENASPFVRYYEQMISIYPGVLARNIMAARRLGEIADDAIKYHES